MTCSLRNLAVRHGAALGFSCLVALAAGCGGSTAETSPQGPNIIECQQLPNTPSTSFLSPIAVQGQPLDVPVGVAVCGDAQGLSLQATAEVRDLDEVLVDSELRGLRAEGSAVLATVHFVPTRSTPYYVRVRFEPGLGQVQRFIPVAIDRSSAPRRRVALPPDVRCGGAELLQSGAVLCEATDGGAMLVRDDGGVAQRWPGSRLALAAKGAQVWVAEGPYLTRYRDEGQGPLIREGDFTAEGDIAWVVPLDAGTALLGRYPAKAPVIQWNGSSIFPGFVEPVSQVFEDAGARVDAGPPLHVTRPEWSQKVGAVGTRAVWADDALWVATNRNVCRVSLDAGSGSCIESNPIGLDGEAARIGSSVVTRTPLGRG
ncbi:MAG: hypothetical protein K1X89_20225, partial [Myxococcaceae bacterium]|nr:hypothetical protein [Myxococcaceae bacterium]